jgi:hypothetical protein
VGEHPLATIRVDEHLKNEVAELWRGYERIQPGSVLSLPGKKTFWHSRGGNLNRLSPTTTFSAAIFAILSRVSREALAIGGTKITFFALHSLRPCLLINGRTSWYSLLLSSHSRIEKPGPFSRWECCIALNRDVLSG